MPESNSSISRISSRAKLGKNCRIYDDAIIVDGAEIGDNCIIEPGVIIYENVKIGADCFVGAQFLLGERLAGFRTEPNYQNPETRPAYEVALQSLKTGQ